MCTYCTCVQEFHKKIVLNVRLDAQLMCARMRAYCTFVQKCWKNVLNACTDVRYNSRLLHVGAKLQRCEVHAVYALWCALTALLFIEKLNPIKGRACALACALDVHQHVRLVCSGIQRFVPLLASFQHIIAPHHRTQLAPPLLYHTSFCTDLFQSWLNHTRSFDFINLATMSKVISLSPSSHSWAHPDEPKF